MTIRTFAISFLLCLSAAAAAAQTPRKPGKTVYKMDKKPPAAAPAPAIPSAPPPSTREVALPEFGGAYAIWGASGADARGHIWLGIASNDGTSGSAHLYEYDPAADVATDRGDVVGQLRRLGLARAGERQMKIHSRVVTGADGLLYFASMDESGENADGSKLPTWGGHLWRLGPRGVWQHLARTPEALIAVAAGERYVYALGYFRHVLYQFDTRTRTLRSVIVGADGGHVSRNFFVDARGHAYVPRVTEVPGGLPLAMLVELTTDLTEAGRHPLTHYFERGLSDSHGIVAVHDDGAGGWYFNTGKGRLYQVSVPASGPATVTDRGWFHPAGSRYVAAMFRDAASGTLFGVSGPSNHGGRRFEWVARRPDGGVSVAPILLRGSAEFPDGALLYGSMTRDTSGRYYVVGVLGPKPLVLQVAQPLSAP
jgi:hypothetical protein